MENQHRRIVGYRELTGREIDLMNEVKQMGTDLGILVQQLQQEPGIDHRWVAIGQTQLQQGMMALTRAIAQPTTF